MSMDARWKVYVQDRRFDDNQISNVYLKLKWETVGRFSFDFRPMDGDESYMVANNTLRIFWGDLHKLDGVIQRVDWDSTQWCYHIYGADIRGLLLERVNTEPATVHSYTSDIQTQVMFQGCDFPTNVWTGSGENIGKYTFRYHIGIQNTIRITSPTIRWENVIERGTVTGISYYYFEDATKNWVPNHWAGNTCRMVSGACKNNIYPIFGNATTKLYLTAALDGSEVNRYFQEGTQWYYNYIENGGFENDTFYPYTEVKYGNTIDGWSLSTASPASGLRCITATIRNIDSAPESADYLQAPTYVYVPGAFTCSFKYKYDGTAHAYANKYFFTIRVIGSDNIGNSWNIGLTVLPLSTGRNPSWPNWDTAYATYTNFTYPGTHTLSIGVWKLPQLGMPPGTIWVAMDDARIYTATASNPFADGSGRNPQCMRVGDIYEIVEPIYEMVQPPSITPATLQQDNHIIQYNNVNDQSDHTTSMTVRGSG